MPARNMAAICAWRVFSAQQRVSRQRPLDCRSRTIAGLCLAALALFARRVSVSLLRPQAAALPPRTRAPPPCRRAADTTIRRQGRPPPTPQVRRSLFLLFLVLEPLVLARGMRVLRPHHLQGTVHFGEGQLVRLFTLLSERSARLPTAEDLLRVAVRVLELSLRTLRSALLRSDSLTSRGHFLAARRCA